jgi:ribosome-interacting GTPase 1
MIPFHTTKQELEHTILTTTTGQLKAKLAKLKRELLTPTSSGGGAGAGFDVARTGVASVYVHGIVSVGDKS